MIYRPLNLEIDIPRIQNFVIRQADEEEMLALNGDSPIRTLMKEVANPNNETYVFINEDDGMLLAIGGLVRSPYHRRHAAPWMIVGTDFDKHKILGVKLVRRMMTAWRKRYRLLINFVDSRNTKAVNFLKYLGAEFPTEYTGFSKNGVLFRTFIFRGRRNR